jgi:alpha-1,6-mannosyltransferase
MTVSANVGWRSPVMPWFAGAAIVIVAALLLAAASRHFGYDTEVIDMPVLVVTAGLVVAGLSFAWAAPRLVATHAALGPRDTRIVLAVIVATGVAARLIMFGSEPVLEDDYQRYLWDGAVTASGANPYSQSPLSVAEAGATGELAPLAKSSGSILRRINHPHLTTIYPPVAQAAFALAHTIMPWSLNACRIVLLGFEIATLGLLLILLKHTMRSPLWVALYWWNPLVLKEVANSAHMDAVVVALVMLVLVLAVTERTLLAAVVLALATAAKLWPVLLLPLVLRPLLANPRRLALAAGMFAAVLVLLMAPMIAAGAGGPSGLSAYAQTWSTNSALLPLLQGAVEGLLQAINVSASSAPLIVRGLLAAVVGVAALVIARRDITDPLDLMTRAGVVVATLVLLSPAQYPWYALWLIPFLAVAPTPALLLMTATLPLYYASFHFAARETLDIAKPVILALIWAPVWTALAFAYWRTRDLKSPSSAAVLN